MGLLHRIWQQWQNQSDMQQYEHLEGIVPHFIHGEHLTTQNGEAVPIFSPSTAQAIRQVYSIDVAQIDTVISTATFAQVEWERTAIATRVALLKHWGELLKASSNEIIRIITQEQGYSEQLATAELNTAISLLDDVTHWKERLAGYISIRDEYGYEKQIRYEALGVIVGIERSHIILPSAIWLISSALCCGNSLIVQPSMRHPSLLVMLADLLKRAGLPDGVFNVLQGNDATVRHLLTNPQINGILFQVASLQDEIIRNICYYTNSAIIVDCHATAIVTENAQLVDTATTITHYFMQGCQNGQKISALMVIDSIADDFIAILKQQILDQLVNKKHCYTGLPTFEAVEETLKRLEMADKEGSLIILEPKISKNKASWFIGLSLVDKVKPDSILLKPSTHILPILPIIRVPDIQAACAIIRANPLFNSVGLFGDNVSSMYMQSLDFSTHQLGMNTLICNPSAYVGLSGMNTYDTLTFFTRSKTIATKYL